MRKLRMWTRGEGTEEGEGAEEGEQKEEEEGDSEGEQVSGFSTACSKFMSIVRRARMVSSRDVTPVFPKKTKCKPICMPGSSFMHIVTYK
jgi:hypothetical protein